MTKFDGDERRQQHWHLSKSVPIALVLTIFFQTMGGVWWAATTQAELRRALSQITDLESRNSKIEKLSERMVILETTMGEVKRILYRIERKMQYRKR